MENGKKSTGRDSSLEAGKMEKSSLLVFNCPGVRGSLCFHFSALSSSCVRDSALGEFSVWAHITDVVHIEFPTLSTTVLLYVKDSIRFLHSNSKLRKMDSELDTCLLVLNIPRSQLGINNNDNIQSNAVISKLFFF